MAYTSHGYHMPGTPRGNPPSGKKKCGGPEFCADCSKETVKQIMLGSRIEPEILLGDNTTNYQHKAMNLVRAYVLENWRMPEGAVAEIQFEVYVVWFAKTLQNWKALVATTIPDSRYYEVTYNGDKGETYLDNYVKIDNVVISDPRDDEGEESGSL